MDCLPLKDKEIDKLKGFRESFQHQMKIRLCKRLFQIFILNSNYEMKSRLGVFVAKAEYTAQYKTDYKTMHEVLADLKKELLRR